MHSRWCPSTIPYQCMHYADWLYVWAKDRTNIPLCQAYRAGSVQSKWSRNSVEGLYDVFKPSFLAAGLKMESNLGHLIFGESAWVAADLLDTPTMLDTSLYTPLFLPQAELRGKYPSHHPTYTYHDPKEMWSITQQFPSNCHWSSDPNVALCKGDPAIPKFHETCKLDRISANLDKPGKRKRGRSDKENTRLQTKLSLINLGYGWLEASAYDTDEEEMQLELVKPKKCRLSADQKLVLTGD
ncbi:hypothetical protein B0H10DRAFT_1950754 [Mycena sp. CBHHK59/15]|nr:hypothetical protein B0H10DRAFT_1950754 [Mycena sp. CBHHK59/15]